jgi:hypothetical protein
LPLIRWFAKLKSGAKKSVIKVKPEVTRERGSFGQRLKEKPNEKK